MYVLIYALNGPKLEIKYSLLSSLCNPKPGILQDHCGASLTYPTSHQNTPQEWRQEGVQKV